MSDPVVGLLGTLIERWLERQKHAPFDRGEVYRICAHELEEVAKALPPAPPQHESLNELLQLLGLTAGATLQSVQRKLGVDTPNAMRLLALRESVLAASPPAQEQEHWAVEVWRNGENLVTIESNCLSGKPEFSESEADTIWSAAEHLKSFIGESLLPAPPLADKDGSDGK